MTDETTDKRPRRPPRWAHDWPRMRCLVHGRDIYGRLDVNLASDGTALPPQGPADHVFVVPPELHQLVCAWGAIKWNHDATVAAAVLDWLDDHGDLFLAANAHKPIRAKRALAANRAYFRNNLADPQRNMTGG